jgi:hypothetical protein
MPTPAADGIATLTQVLEAKAFVKPNQMMVMSKYYDTSCRYRRALDVLNILIHKSSADPFPLIFRANDQTMYHHISAMSIISYYVSINKRNVLSSRWLPVLRHFH